MRTHLHRYRFERAETANDIDHAYLINHAEYQRMSRRSEVLPIVRALLRTSGLIDNKLNLSYLYLLTNLS